MASRDSDDESGSDVDSNPTTVELRQTQNDDPGLLEPWADWIRRVTHEAELRMEKLNIEDWFRYRNDGSGSGWVD